MKRLNVSYNCKLNVSITIKSGFMHHMYLYIYIYSNTHTCIKEDIFSKLKYL